MNKMLGEIKMRNKVHLFLRQENGFKNNDSYCFILGGTLKGRVKIWDDNIAVLAQALTKLTAE